MHMRSVVVASKSDIRRAAEAFRDAVAELGRYRIVASDNIATRRPMTDDDGAILAECVFGFRALADQWWRNGQLALQSPMARACRYESQPFWANSDGFRTQHQNLYLDGISLNAFDERSFLHAAIIVPVHLPFGQIGMAAFGAFMYLEVLDASFSLDGVIGAFAITNEIALIIAGLGAGAIWVRSLTVYLMKSGTLSKYRYLEHGAHWAILALGVIMFVKLYQVNPPEWLTGSLGLIVISIAVISSIIEQKRLK